MNTLSSLFAFLGLLCLLFHGTADGAPIPKEVIELVDISPYMLVPAKTIANYDLPEFSTIAKPQPNYLGRRDNTAGGLFRPTVADTVTSGKVEEIRRKAVGFLRGLAEKLQNSYKWVKTSKGWEWVQKQGTKIGELVKKAWNWFSRVILRRKLAAAVATEAKIKQNVVDDSYTAAVPPAGDDNNPPKDNRKGKGAMVPPIEVSQEEAVERHYDQTRPPRDKGKGRALKLMPATEDIHTEQNAMPLLAHGGDANVEMEDEPGYGDTPGSSNYRGKAWEKHTNYIRPAFGDAVPALLRFGSGPDTEIDTDPTEAHQSQDLETKFAQAPVSEAIGQAPVAELQAPVMHEAPAVHNKLILISPSLGDAVPAVFGLGPYTGPAQQVPVTEPGPVINEASDFEKPVHRYIRPALGDAVPAVFATGWPGRPQAWPEPAWAVQSSA